MTEWVQSNNLFLLKRIILHSPFSNDGDIWLTFPSIHVHDYLSHNKIIFKKLYETPDTPSQIDVSNLLFES